MQTPTVPHPVSRSGIVKSIVYRVESATEPGVSYEVGVNPLTRKPQSCTCPASGYGRDCWHKRAVRDGKVTAKPRVTYGPRLTVPGADLYA